MSGRLKANGIRNPIMTRFQRFLIVLLITLGFVSARNCPAADPAPLKVGITSKFAFFASSVTARDRSGDVHRRWLPAR
jgi:hypothetical protein